MNSIFNIMIILIPVAIFIGRIVVQARSKHTKPPPQPHIPIHFEDDDYEGPKASQEYALSLPGAPPPNKKRIPAPSLKRQEMRKMKKIIDDRIINNEMAPSSPATGAILSAAIAPPKPALEGQNAFISHLSHLSPMKQAIVMAEVLGPPKALQE